MYQSLDWMFRYIIWHIWNDGFNGETSFIRIFIYRFWFILCTQYTMTCFTLIEKYKFLWTLKIFSIVAACLLPVSQASIIPFLLATLIVKHSKLFKNIIKKIFQKKNSKIFYLDPSWKFFALWWANKRCLHSVFQNPKKEISLFFS